MDFLETRAQLQKISGVYQDYDDIASYAEQLEPMEDDLFTVDNKLYKEKWIHYLTNSFFSLFLTSPSPIDSCRIS